MLSQAFDDNGTIKASKMPSALVEVPKVNERYETTSYTASAIQGRDLQALKIAENKGNNPVLNINSAFFG
jgi:hypothetical protein